MRMRFGSYVFDTGKRELTRGGKDIALSPKALRLLELLADAAPEAVPRDALYRALWGDVFVHDANLPNLISEIRTALNDDARHPQFIKTMHRFGYRFEARVAKGSSHAVQRTRAVVVWAGREYPLHEGENLLGRDATAEVQIDLAGVSRRHAVITIDGSDATIEDLDSKNGTFVRGSSVKGSAILAAGDAIRLGPASVVFRVRSADETTVTDYNGEALRKP